MIKVEVLDVQGFEPAIHAMRNPKNSWDKSDSYMGCRIEECDRVNNKLHPIGEPQNCENCGWCEPLCNGNPERQTYIIGDNDLKLMKRLFNGGVEHRTYLRMIQVWVDIEAPLYWWKEMDRYTVGKNQISTSTMHKIADKEFTLDNFSHEHLDFFGMRTLENTITALNDYRDAFNTEGSHKTFMNMIQLLPSSYNQKRTVNMSYETIFKILKERSNHPLDEWIDFCGELRELPYIKEIMGYETN